MKSNRRMIMYVFYTLFGALLFGLGCMEKVDEFWCGMGSAFMMVGILRLIRIYRFKKDEDYREKVEIEISDERNRFIRNKAWAWAGYLFIMIAGSSVIILKIAGQEMWSLAASYAVCLVLMLYWVSYLILRRRY